MATHLEMLGWLNSVVVVVALIVIGISGYAGYSGQGHFNLAYGATALGVVMEILACWGLVGAKLRSVKMLVLYFWMMFVLIVGQVVVMVLTFFQRDEVFQYVTENADKMNLSPEEIQPLINSIQSNLAFLGVCLSVLIVVQTVALMLASMHFKRSCLGALNSLSRLLGQGVFFIGIGIRLGSSSTENEFGHASFFGAICMIAGAYVFLLGSIGLQGVKRESPSIIGIYFWLMFFTLLGEVTGSLLLLFKKDQVINLVRLKMSDRSANFSEKEIEASMDLVRSHLQMTAILGFLLIFKQTLAVVLSLQLRSDLRGNDSALLDRDLLELLPNAAEQTKEMIKDYAQPSKWSDTYKQMRRKYDDFDDFS
eukprot:c46416_g1_i1.p1 GENE.c46416_g1_i1~~c46416_g1_i1.p1  ORF type:complete len:366 (+),score=84.21 c46416_g1_i1:40-1137(+)